MALLKGSEAIGARIGQGDAAVDGVGADRAVTAASSLIKVVSFLKCVSYVLVGTLTVMGAVLFFQLATGAAGNWFSLVSFAQMLIGVASMAVVLFQVEKMLDDMIEHKTAFTSRQPARLRIIAACLFVVMAIGFALSLVVVAAGGHSFGVSLGGLSTFPDAAMWESVFSGASAYAGSSFQVVIDVPGLLLCVFLWFLSYVLEVEAQR